MKPLTASQVEEYLRRAGFAHVRTRGSHFVWTHPADGRTTTVPHHGNRTLAAEELGMSERTLYRKLPEEFRKK